MHGCMGIQIKEPNPLRAHKEPIIFQTFTDPMPKSSIDTMPTDYAFPHSYTVII
jgi:hypothetical protein